MRLARSDLERKDYLLKQVELERVEWQIAKEW